MNKFPKTVNKHPNPSGFKNGTRLRGIILLSFRHGGIVLLKFIQRIENDSQLRRQATLTTVKRVTTSLPCSFVLPLFFTADNGVLR